MFMNRYSEVDCAKNFLFLWSCVQIKKPRQSNIVSPPTIYLFIWGCYTKYMNKYIQKDYHGFISQSLHIAHGLWTLLPLYLYWFCRVSPKPYNWFNVLYEHLLGYCLGSGKQTEIDFQKNSENILEF